MTKGELRSGSVSRTALAGLLAASAGLGQVAAAGDWVFGETTDFRATYVDRSGANSQAGTVLQLSPAFTLDGAGARSRANVFWRPTLSEGWGTTDPRTFTNELISRGEVDLVDDFFTLGADAGASLQGDSGIAGDVDAINVDTDGRQRYSVGLTPIFRARAGRYVEFLSRNRFDYVWTDKSDDPDGDDDSYRQLYNLTAQSSRYFNNLGWRVSGNHSITEYENRSNDERSDLIATALYRFSPQLRVDASAGYEWNDVETSRDRTDGLTWGVGANWSPSPRTGLSAAYRNRYFGNEIRFDATHVSRRTRLALGVSREIDNQRNDVLVDNFFFLADDQGAPVIDPATGDPIVVNSPSTETTDEDFITERLRAAVGVVGQRTSANLRGSVYRRYYEVSDQDEDGYRFGFDVSRQLGLRLSASLFGDYDFVDNRDGDDSNYYRFAFSLTRSIGRESGVALNLSYAERDADNEDLSYDESRVGVTFFTSLL